MVAHVLILWGLVVLALAVAFVVERRRKRDDDKAEYAVALGFVASSYGLLHGLLVAFGANHHSDVRQQAQNEAVTRDGEYSWLETLGRILATHATDVNRAC